MPGVAHCQVDPHTGELHLLSFEPSPSQLHVAVSHGALISGRSGRSTRHAPAGSGQLELARDDVVLVADDCFGISARAGVATKPMWFEVDTEGRHIAGAYAHAETMIVYATGPPLVQLTLTRAVIPRRSLPSKSKASTRMAASAIVP